MKVKVKFISEDAKALYLKASKEKSIFPFKEHDSDFCYDVVATSREEVAPNVYKYGIGLALQIRRGCEIIQDGGEGWERLFRGNCCLFESYDSPLKFSIDLRPRSSIWKTGMVLANCEGTIDEHYIGEVAAIFYDIMPDMPNYEVGDKIGQIKIGATFPIEFVEVDSLDSTERGDGGFGSTGK
jgi:dUTP pyrophosphatase